MSAGSFDAELVSSLPCFVLLDVAPGDALVTFQHGGVKAVPLVVVRGVAKKRQTGVDENLAVPVGTRLDFGHRPGVHIAHRHRSVDDAPLI